MTAAYQTVMIVVCTTLSGRLYIYLNKWKWFKLISFLYNKNRYGTTHEILTIK